MNPQWDISESQIGLDVDETEAFEPPRDIYESEFGLDVDSMWMRPRRLNPGGDTSNLNSDQWMCG